MSKTLIEENAYQTSNERPKVLDVEEQQEVIDVPVAMKQNNDDVFEVSFAI